ncbi:MAG TPA: ferritin-like domain-containing protein [Steroidobacteraceae bacterium]|jgi:bacterioferritin
MSANLATPYADQVHPFLSNLAELRRQARRDIALGSARAGQSDPQAVLNLLNAALATELACLRRYQRYADMSAEMIADAVRNEFTKRAQEEQGHADQITARIIELGGEPQPAADGAEPTLAKDMDEEGLTDMLAEDLISERIAMDTYGEIIGFLGDQDAQTRALFEAILIAERSHAAELVSIRDHMRGQDRTALGAT